MSPYPPRGSAAVENRRRSYWSLTWFQKAGAERESLHQTRIEVHPRTLRSDLGRGGSRSHRGHLRPRNSSVPSYRPTTIQGEQAQGREAGGQLAPGSGEGQRPSWTDHDVGLGAGGGVQSSEAAAGHCPVVRQLELGVRLADLPSRDQVRA